MQIAVIMDSIAAIKPAKDSTLAMLLEAQRRDHAIAYAEPSGLDLVDGHPYLHFRWLTVRDDSADWFSLGQADSMALADLDCCLLRSDPPFDMEYVFDTYILERAWQEGLLVVNRPDSVRDANEKLFTAWFPEVCPPTLVSRSPERLQAFVAEQGSAVIKPLDGMGGAGVFRADAEDLNLKVIIDTVSQGGRRLTMAQRYIQAIREQGPDTGDKRILLIDGEPVPYALARIPPGDDFRGNLAVGGRGEARPLSEADQRICAAVGPTLKEKGLLFVGLDVIGGYLTEINVTSPTCIRELDEAFDLNIAGKLFDAIERRLTQSAVS